MLRNRTQDDREREAAQDLKRISEIPWGLQAHLRQTPVILKKISNYVNSAIDSKKTRPNTQQTPRRNHETFQLRNKNHRFRSMFTQDKRNDKSRYRLSENPSPSQLSQPSREKSQLRERKLLKKKNYSQLRKYMEKDFFVGNYSVNLIKKTEQTKSASKSLRKGRLWLGRPLIMMPLDKYQGKHSPFFEQKF